MTDKADLHRLGLSLYVIAYGLGPMLLHPLVEMPQVGKLPVCQ
jgi:hypothetical protein